MQEKRFCRNPLPGLTKSKGAYCEKYCEIGQAISGKGSQGKPDFLRHGKSPPSADKKILVQQKIFLDVVHLRVSCRCPVETAGNQKLSRSHGAAVSSGLLEKPVLRLV